MLYHVAATSLPAGQVLRPYAVARDYVVPLRLVEEALSVGSRAVLQLLAGVTWKHVLQHGRYPVEMVVLEAIFERVRMRTAPDLPSRYDAVFAWGTMDLATRYRTEYSPSGVIHRCALVAGTRVERGGALIVEASEVANLMHPQAEDLQWVEDRAAQYWLGRRPMAFPEVLVHGTVVVGGIADGSAEG